MGRLVIFLFLALIGLIIVLAFGAYNLLKILEALAVGIVLFIVAALAYMIFGRSSNKKEIATYKKTGLLSGF